ncbi:MAG: cation-transporting P-type ATPase, partial [Nanoarchaeota archaeon]
MEFYNLTEKEILKEFGSSRAGLSDSEALLRLEKYGKNEIKKAKGVSKLKIFLSQFNSIVVYILIAALIISAIIQEYLDSVVIGSILVINGILGFFQEYKAEKAVEALR